MSLSERSKSDFFEAVSLFDSRVAATTSEAWSSPSPCEGWSAIDIVAHCASNLRALRDSLAGRDPSASFGQPIEGDVVAAWAEVSSMADRLVALATEHESILVRGNAMPPELLLDALMRDLVIHTWDLACAVGGDQHLPANMVAAATAAMATVGPEMRGPGRYGPELPTPPDADAQTRLLALSGRKAY